MEDAREWLWNVGVSGVNFTVAGTGGPPCAQFISARQKVLESILATCVAGLVGYYGWTKVTLPETVPEPCYRDRTSRKLVLFLLTLVYGMELGFKLSTHQLIWILNPCHMITMLQLLLLVAPPGSYTMAVFRVMLHCLNGGTLALVFPILNTRILPLERHVYFVQHILMLVIPFYQLRIGGVYSAEPLTDISYLCIAESMLFLYHWIVLQPLALLTNVNLNNILCPAISDPFHGPYYRMAACIHQSLMILVHGKLYTWLALRLLGKSTPRKPDSSTSNGHLKAN